MKIKRIDIDSFGTIKQWHSGDIDENITVVYGPNEAGKSTVTEFIRSTLFPMRGNRYPGSSKTDSGSLNIVMDNGEERTLKREQKKVTEVNGKRTVAEEFSGLDPDTYRALYGLDLEQLVNSKLISSGDFRSKFMTIPGGDNIPAISNDINDRIAALMNRDRMTDTKIIGACLKEIKDTDAQIAEIAAQKATYDELYAERENLKQKVEETRKIVEASQNENLKKKMMRSQQSNLKRLEELESTRAEYIKYESFNTSDKEKYDSLTASIEDLKKDIPETSMDDKNRAIILSRRDEIENAYRGLDDYSSKKKRIVAVKIENNDLSDEIKKIENDTGWSLDDALAVNTGSYISSKAQAELKRQSLKEGPNNKLMKLYLAGGIVLVILGTLFIGRIIDIGDASMIVGGVLVGAGLIGVSLNFIMPHRSERAKKSTFDWNDWIISEGYRNGTTPDEAMVLSEKLQRMKDYYKRIQANRQEIQELEADVSLYARVNTPLASAMKVPGELDESVPALNRMLQQAIAEEQEALRIKSLQTSVSGKEKERTAILRKYGSEEELINAYEGKKTLEATNAEIATIKKTIESSSGVPIDDLRAFLSNDEGFDVGELKDNSEENNQRIGQLSSMMDAIMKDDELIELQTKKSAAEARLKDYLREWAVYNIARNMIGEACDHFYSDLQPSVVKTANEYLSIMTDGRYVLDNNPASNEIAIKDNRSVKTSDQWSSGLGDQVYLSIKMALAKEVADESMPMLMDDILVRFDSSRKEAACKAISKFAEDNQVIMFTCDNSLSNYFRIYGKVNEIRL